MLIRALFSRLAWLGVAGSGCRREVPGSPSCVPEGGSGGPEHFLARQKFDETSQLGEILAQRGRSRSASQAPVGFESQPLTSSLKEGGHQEPLDSLTWRGTQLSEKLRVKPSSVRRSRAVAFFRSS